MRAGLRLKVSRRRHGGVPTVVDSLVATSEYSVAVGLFRARD
jgi:hypothetical protein